MIVKITMGNSTKVRNKVKYQLSPLFNTEKKIVREIRNKLFLFTSNMIYRKAKRLKQNIKIK